jgi:hypothetical protein
MLELLPCLSTAFKTHIHMVIYSTAISLATLEVAVVIMLASVTVSIGLPRYVALDLRSRSLQSQRCGRSLESPTNP